LINKKGNNFTERSRGFNVGLYVLLKDKDALNVYKDHELHIKFMNDYLAPVKEDVVALDFESHN
jgi:hypothetical protein